MPDALTEAALTLTFEAQDGPRPVIRLVRVPWLIPWWARAQVWGATILLRHDVDLTAELLAHELAHVQQWRTLGIAPFLWCYARFLLRRGYWHHPLELAARAAERHPGYLAWARSILHSRLPP